MMTCDEARIALVDGVGVPGLEAHLASCGACGAAATVADHLRACRRAPPEALDRAVLASARLAPPPSRGRFAPWVAVAASLLVAAGLLALGRDRTAPAPGPGTPLPAPASFPRRLGNGQEVTVAVLGPGSGVTADAGSELRLASLAEAELLAGRVFVRSAGTLTLRTPFGTCTTQGAAFECACPAPRRLAGGFVRSALADEGQSAGELFVEEGTVTFRAAGEALQVSAGQIVRIRPGQPIRCEVLEPSAALARLAWRDGQAPWQEFPTANLEGWESTGAGQAQVIGGALRLTSRGPVGQRLRRAFPPAERFEWSATFRRLEGGYLEVLLPADRVLTLGEMPQLGDGREHVLTLRWDVTPALFLDGIRLKEVPTDQVPSGSPGLGVTHGVLEITRWRWRRLP